MSFEAWKVVVSFIVVPYLLGCKISSFLVAKDALHVLLGSFPPVQVAQESSIVDTESCHHLVNEYLGLAEGVNPLEGMSIVTHRNGQAEGCGTAVDVWETLLQVIRSKDCSHFDTKYEFESLFTSVLHSTLQGACASEEDDRAEAEGFLGFCDMGEDKTPILLDHDKLVPIWSQQGTEYLPCHFHTREGLRISTLLDLVQLTTKATTTASDKQQECVAESDQDGNETCQAPPSKEIHLYAVPAGRVFVFAPSYVGEIFHLDHVQGSDNRPIHLEVISVSPRVFDVFHFFSKDESAALVDRALKETSESHRIKRSSTGASGYNLSRRRTSENGFDTHGKVAVLVKRRCFDALGFDEYLEGHGDGLQILRYNKTKAYIPHMDWIDDPTGRLEHNYDSGGKGGNRFATILMYMSDLEEGDGGETVFSRADGRQGVDCKTALADLQASEQGDILERGSWEEDMVAKCRCKLSVRPNSARAVLFYSQLPNGQPDPMSLHGGCPVLTDTPKWAANLWVWNTPRDGFPGAPRNERVLKEKQGMDVSRNPTPAFKQLQAHFENTGQNPAFDNAQLFFQEDSYWGNLGRGDPVLSANTYEGHVWNVKVDGKIVQTWTITDEEVQNFSI